MSNKKVIRNQIQVFDRQTKRGNEKKQLKGVKQEKLIIKVCDQPIDDLEDDSLTFYFVQGSTIKRRTQNSNLCQKLEEYKSIQKQKKDKRLQILVEKLHQQQQNTEKFQIFRYYDIHTFCNRCKKQGHFQSVCPSEKRCFFCLSKNHSMNKCQQKICFQCFKIGHINSVCPQRKIKKKCKKCERFHEGQCFFLTKGKSMKILDFNSFESSEIRCLDCSGYGHLNCQNETTHEFETD